ncbi:MAG TPA: hypothetical protein VFS22_06530 [Flavisolibacter sp.]|nr:hypothetical protein [Flavisolibacter sp.]
MRFLIMENTTLIFKSLTELWEFKQSTKATEININTDKKSLMGNFTPDEIELALHYFHAFLPENDQMVKK